MKNSLQTFSGLAFVLAGIAGCSTAGPVVSAPICGKKGYTNNSEITAVWNIDAMGRARPGDDFEIFGLRSAGGLPGVDYSHGKVIGRRGNSVEIIYRCQSQNSQQGFFIESPVLQVILQKPLRPRAVVSEQNKYVPVRAG